MASDENHDFQISGPKNLQADWKDSHYRISAVACLVQGVYVLEGDRQYREGGRSPSRYCRERDGRSPNLAPDWWESFGFQYRTEILVGGKDHSIFGAIYKFESQISNNESAPTYVISLRGTILELSKTGWEDLKENTQILFGTLHRSSRFKQVMEAVENKVRSVGAAKFWLAGHSQGAAIVLLVGKEMAKKGWFFETYLFNPPNISGLSEWLKNPKLKLLTRLSSNIIKAGVAFALQGHHQIPQDDQCIELSGWTPFLFVNPEDYICSKYIADFEFKKMMEELGLGNLVRFAMHNSIKTQCLRVMGEDSKPFHVIPSAYLNINSSPSLDLKQTHGKIESIFHFVDKNKKAHGIEQWWSPDFECQTIPYLCSSETTNVGR